MRLNDFLLKNRKEKNIRLFFDIETLQYNEIEGKKKPSKFKNVTYSVAVSYFDSDEKLYVDIFPNFKEFFDTILATYSKWKTLPKIELIAHNSNKYDNHYLRHDILYYYPHTKIKNLYLKSANEEGNVLSFKPKDIPREEKEGVILEKRIKSSNNLEMIFFLNGIHFYTTDNFMKTHTSIGTLGKKLLRIGAVTEDQLKTDFDYVKYNKSYDMTEEEAREYALEVHQNLSEEELTYIRNDVIILGMSVLHYSKLFNGFDYSKITFTSNILEFYNDNDLTSYQLLKRVGDYRNRIHLKYTDYKFANENFYDYLKPFYSGGLNMYNDQYVGVLIKEKMFSIDINSSYPYSMHNFKIPTYLKNYDSFEKEKTIEVSISDDEYFLYRMTKETFDYEILDKIDSRMFRQMLVKYYSKGSYININTYTLKLVENICGIKFDKLTVLSYISFECLYFGSRDKIEENYRIKTQGSTNKKIIMKSPYLITVLDEENTDIFTQEEVENSKILLNGLYGIPALRPYFNLFRQLGGSLENIANGYKNSERNIVFSIFVTSVSLYNLLNPLKYLTQKEIDENLIYTDTDSLYLKSAIRHKLPSSLFDSNILGKWDIQDNEIDMFYVLNHKKYAYYAYHKKKKKKTIIIKSGGVSHDSFDTNMSFEEFINTQFSHGKVIYNLKSILNEQGTISLYEAPTELTQGDGYRLFTHDETYESQKEILFDNVRKQTKGNTEDALYIESNLGTFSMSDLYPIKNPIKDKKPLIFFEMLEDSIRKEIEQH